MLIHKQQQKLVNETANEFARVSGQDRKKPPALGTNQIAGFGEFRPLGNWEKSKFLSYHRMLAHIDIPVPAVIGMVHVAPTSLMQLSGFIWTSNQMSRGGGMCRPIG